MLDRFRKNEGADQLDMFPEDIEDRNNKRAFKLACAAVLGFIALFFLIGPAPAEEVTSPPMIIQGGIICDTIEEVKVFIDSKGVETPEGCGVLRSGALATVTLLEKYESNNYGFAIARYDFLTPPLAEQPQYGFWGNPVKLASLTDI